MVNNPERQTDAMPRAGKSKDDLKEINRESKYKWGSKRREAQQGKWRNIQMKVNSVFVTSSCFSSSFVLLHELH